MKLAVGYQLAEDSEESFVDVVNRYAGDIGEVYFPWPDIQTGRAPLTNRRGFIDWGGQKRLENDLVLLRKAGMKLDLLMNANCYGGDSVSEYLANKICSVLYYLGEITGGIDIVTTASPAIAHIIKKNFHDIEVRASVNMRIGTVKGMQYIAGTFDSFCIQREYNRDFERMRELKQWADDNGKRLILLANSGCLNFCSGQTFHDNLVAHETEIDERVNIPNLDFHVCRNYYKNRANWVSVLQSSWVRPEDLKNYEEYFTTVKLATRMHNNPGMVIMAYAERKFYGNLLDLLEPGFSPGFAPYFIDNGSFPEDWFRQTSECSKDCHKCNYCESVLNKVLFKMENIG